MVLVLVLCGIWFGKCEFVFVVKRKRRSCDGLMGGCRIVMGVALYTLLSFWVMATSTTLSVGPVERSASAAHSFPSSAGAARAPPS